MSEVAVCPDRQEIERWRLGRLREEQAASLDEHLFACERCCQILHELDLSDPLAETLRTAGARKSEIDDRVRAVMAHLKEVTLPGKAMEDTVARAPEATEDAWDLARLLDPPEAEGELGRFGGYRVLRVLGAGGMGLVFEAEDPKLRRRVALKVMKRSLASHAEHHQRFLREARAAAAIEHPHIVTVYQVGEHNGLPFLAMQLLKGEALDDRLKRDSRLPLAECLRIGRETAEALAEAHQRNLIHRDIKPGNIWLEGGSGWVKLVDFGLAHAAEDVHLTQTGAILGTPAYMSPEQARGEAVDGRSDLYSLGAVLYKLTTGDVPFRGTSTMAVLIALATEAPRPPRELNPGIPPPLDDLIMRLLAKTPSDRFESAAALAEAIRAIEQESLKSQVETPISEMAGAERSNVRRGYRWPQVAVAVTAFCVLAAILVIVRDKEGNELARVNVPPDGKVEIVGGVVDGQANPPPAPTIGARGSSAVPGDIPPPTEISEPPTLNDWLKGRTVLSVAQDGSGQFKTIQAALNALKAGEAVEVLDGGPYRETLRLVKPPRDIGLFSRHQTVLELGEWKREPMISSEYLQGHSFLNADGFRLSGFRLIYKKHAKGQGAIYCLYPVGLLIEDCATYAASSVDDNHGTVSICATLKSDSAAKPMFVRDCVFVTGGVQPVGQEPGSIVFLRNYFRGSCLHTIARFEALVIRSNVFDGNETTIPIMINSMNAAPRVLEISNNTLFSTAAGAFWNDAPPRGVVVRNNILRFGIAFPHVSNDERDRAIQGWKLDHNGFPRQNTDFSSASDVIGEPDVLSADPQNRDYLRVRAEGAWATAGAGGEWPSYLGALPPGPAPKEGDWFTRLQERWPPSGLEDDSRGNIWTPRSIAQWVMGHGGKIQFADGALLSKPEEAPPDAKRFYVSFEGVKDFGDDDVTIMTQWSSYECQPNLKGTALTDVGLRRLASINTTRVDPGEDYNFNVTQCAITGEGFDAFKDKRIGHLAAHNCALTEVGWRRISETGRIELAYLAHTGMTDSDLAIFLAAHPETSALHLRGNPLTDRAIELLAQRNQWGWLNLGATGITDASVPLLSKLQIGSLNIPQTKLTQAGVAALRKALPTCKIEWNDGFGTSSSAAWTPPTIAQWVLDRGGRIQFNGSRTDLAQAKDAPADCKNLDVFFENVNDFGDDDVTVMTQWNQYPIKPYFRGVNLTDAGLRRLALLKLGIAGFAVYDCPITGEGFDAFKGKEIGTLTVSYCKMTDAGWHRLAEVGGISKAFLSKTDMDDDDLAIYLTGHPETRELELGYNPLTDQAVELLARRKRWDWLALGATRITDASVPSLAGLEQIGQLEVWGTSITTAGVAKLRKALPNSKIKWNDGFGTQDSAVWTPKMIAQWVMDRGGRVQFADGVIVSKPEDAPADAKHFDLFFENVAGFNDDAVAVMTQWDKFAVKPNLRFVALTDVGLRRLASLNMGAGFNVWGCPITGEGFDAFKGKKIGTLVANECKLTEAGWHRLAETGEIDIAYLGITEMSDSDLAIYLAGHPETHSLNVGDNPITDKAVELLTHRKQWDWLALNKTGITDASVPLLASLERIRSLEIKGTKITAAGVTELRKALPNCKIGWDDGGAAGSPPWNQTARSAETMGTGPIVPRANQCR